MRAQGDGRHREEDMHHLVERLKRKQSRANLVRRPYSPKGEGQRRPLGLPAVEDQRRQLAVRRRLQAIYRTFCAVAMGLGRGWERWRPSTG
jgi:retron-type reverse transcriptase